MIRLYVGNIRNNAYPGLSHAQSEKRKIIAVALICKRNVNNDGITLIPFAYIALKTDATIDSYPPMHNPPIQRLFIFKSEIASGAPDMS